MGADTFWDLLPELVGTEAGRVQEMLKNYALQYKASLFTSLKPEEAEREWQRFKAIFIGG